MTDWPQGKVRRYRYAGRVIFVDEADRIMVGPVDEAMYRAITTKPPKSIRSRLTASGGFVAAAPAASGGSGTVGEPDQGEA